MIILLELANGLRVDNYTIVLMETFEKGGGVSSENTWDCSQTLFFQGVDRVNIFESCKTCLTMWITVNSL
jgi:hypothetical protein